MSSRVLTDGWYAGELNILLQMRTDAAEVMATGLRILIDDVECEAEL